MEDDERSAKRRRVLSSINPDIEPRWQRPEPTEGAASQVEDAAASDPPRPTDDANSQEAHDDLSPDKSSSRAKRLRLKDETSGRHRRRHRSRSRSRSRSASPRRRSRRDGRLDGRDHGHGEHHRHHRHHHRRRHHRRSPTPPNPHEPPPLSPDAAFRESLFDAMADDEGAEYWAAVYGQPVHTYGRALETMDEDEYATYVRRRMWERTHHGQIEEAERRREARRRAHEREEEEEASAARKRRRREDGRVGRDLEESLARGEERRRRREGRRAWEEYLAAWSLWDGTGMDGLVWPIRGGGEWGKREIEEGAVGEFLAGGLDHRDPDSAAEFSLRLREERVKWHPDKMQQKLGGKVEEAVMRDVTAVFQIIDKLWNEAKNKGQ